MTDAERNARVNIWPDNLPGFKETLQEYHGSIEKLGRKFLPLWATALNCRWIISTSSSPRRT